MPTDLSFQQIKAEVAALGRRKAIERPVGIRAPGRWLGEPLQKDGETGYLIHQCDSPLAIRRALRQPAPEQFREVRQVIVTSLPDADLSSDIFARLHRQRLFSIDRWSLVQQLFAAESIDPQLAQHDWLADAAIEHLADRPPAAVKSGCLGAETLWRELLAATIDYRADVPDLQSLLRWSLEPANVQRFRSLAEPLREAMRAWVASRAGEATEFVFAAAVKSDQPDAVPLALVAGVLTAREAEGRAERFLTRLEERYLAHREWPHELLIRVAEEAASLLRAGLSEATARRRLLARAEELLGNIDATPLAASSSILPIGLAQRLAKFATEITTFTEDPEATLDTVIDAAGQVRAHDLMQASQADQDRLDMTLRLVRWLDWRRGSSSQPGSLGDAAAAYLEHGSFVDWARDAIGSLADSRELSSAVSALQSAVVREQQRDAAAFGKLLHNAVAMDSYSDSLIPIEQVLDTVVAPLAQDVPVLLVVLDGMSAAVCRELLASIASDQRHRWVPLMEAGRHAARPALATIPSETHFSRASLLAGKLTSGGNEAAAFAAHPGLVAASTARKPPVLFAKSDLAGNELPDAIRDEIATTSRRVVGVIINAVDDHLAKAAQLSVRWSPETVPLLSALLYEAGGGKRAVVLTSDHGHVLERGTGARVHEGGSRWRVNDSSSLEADELAFRGRRVLASGGELVSSWSEQVRYTAPTSRGYHGGVNPQEMLVPLAVLIPEGTKEPQGWQAAPEQTPLWWEEVASSSELIDEPPPPPAPPPKGMLFDPEQLKAPPPPASDDASDEAPGAASPVWIEQLMATDVFESQRKRVARGYAGDAVFKQMLASLDTRGGRITKTALARAIDYPPFRISGLLSHAQRLFNVDGYPAITVDLESDTVILQKGTLLVQFGLADAGEAS